MLCKCLPPCTGCLPVSLNDRAVDEHVFEVELVRQLVENTLEDTRKRPVAVALEHSVPVAETLRKVAPEEGLEKMPIVRAVAPESVALPRSMCSIRAQMASVRTVLSAFTR